MEFSGVALFGTISFSPGFEEADGIVLFGPIVAAFHAGDKDFEAFDEARVFGHRLGERRDFDRMSEHQRWLDQLRLNQFESFDIASPTLGCCYLMPRPRPFKNSRIDATILLITLNLANDAGSRIESRYRLRSTCSRSF